MCLVKVDSIHLNFCVHDATQRVVSCEDKLMLTSSLADGIVHLNLLDFGGAEERSLTTVNVHYMQIFALNNFQKLTAKLLCKQNTRSNNHNGFVRICGLKYSLGVHNCRESFTCSGGKDELTFVILIHAINTTLLMRTKSDGHRCLMNMNILCHEKTTPSRGGRQFNNCHTKNPSSPLYCICIEV